jgi:hypothetical protein
MTGWQVHAWCVMSNQYHLAVSTPRANLVVGMRWLQGTFATRFNRFRGERGHLFQGRYKSLIVDPAEGLGPLCHYIHLNPVRAKLCTVAALRRERWTSLRWLIEPGQRPAWYDPAPALAHAGELADTPAGRQKYREYLAWLAEDEPARKQQLFAEMSSGWIIGSRAFAKEMVREHAQAVGRASRGHEGVQRAREEIWRETLDALLRKLRRRDQELAATGKSVDWKLAVAAALKARTTVTNRWLATELQMGNLHEVSRKVSAWNRQPDPALMKKLKWTTNPKA